MKTANDYQGLCDSDIIQAAIDNRENGIAIIPPRAQETEPERSWWLLDRAILLPANTTVILQNCKLKMSDKSRDNFFRTANCGLDIPEIEPTENIHIRGEGLCILEGADHPRSTGDGSKILAVPCPKLEEDLVKYADWIPEERKISRKFEFMADCHEHTYGTDFDKEGQSHYGDWRNVGVLFARVSNFSVSNLKIVESHGWGMSFEDCAHGYIDKICFDARMAREIDGMVHNIENQDGVNLRNGCHDIVISNITGTTGDDLIALTAIAMDGPIRPCGALRTTHVMHNDWSRRERDIHDVIIRNVRGYSAGGCGVIRLLPAQTNIYNIVIDGVIDTSDDDLTKRWGPMLDLGDGGEYGENTEDSLRYITISNIICRSNNQAIHVGGFLADSIISNVINKNPNCPCIKVLRKKGLRNVTFGNLVSTGGEDIVYHNA